MRYPTFLPNNGTIGFLAPSFGCATEPYKSLFDNAQKRWHEEGYKLLLGPNCYEGSGVGISASPEKCAEEVNRMFESDADVLISCGGGELMCEILPYVDFERLAIIEPKWFMGYSDNTNLTYLLATIADTASVYGPCAGSFGAEPLHESLSDAMEILRGERTSVHEYGTWEKEKSRDEEHPLAGYNLTEELHIKAYMGKNEISDDNLQINFSGRLIGGCMDCLVNLTGTKFDHTKEFLEKYKEDGFIWFLEACDLNVFAIRRAMWQMEQAGWFRYVKGFLIGRPANGEPMMNLDKYDAVLEVAGKFGVPVLMDVDLGHLPPMMPLVVGAIAQICYRSNQVKMKMEFC